jgi:hypothetical protein
VPLISNYVSVYIGYNEPSLALALSTQSNKDQLTKDLFGSQQWTGWPKKYLTHQFRNKFICVPDYKISPQSPSR